MENTETLLAIISIILGVYVPIWIFIQTQKKSHNREMINEIRSLKEEFVAISNRHEVQLISHEKRLDVLDRKIG
jgi:hypothetical protein